jgi:hypothetical protein
LGGHGESATERHFNQTDDGDLNSFDDDKEVMTKVDFTCGARLIYSVGSLTFGALSATLTATVVNAICYGAAPQCSDCGPSDDGTKKIYAVATGGAAAKPIVSYWLDGGAAAAQTSSIAVAANAEAPNDIIVFGGYLVVLSPTANTCHERWLLLCPARPGDGRTRNLGKSDHWLRRQQRPNRFLPPGANFVDYRQGRLYLQSYRRDGRGDCGERCGDCYHGP